MPVYEIVVNILMFALIWQLQNRNWQDGRLFLLYLILYSIERFILAFTSSYRVLAFGLTQSQIVAAIAFVVGPGVLAWMSRKPQRQTHSQRKMEENCYVEPIYKNMPSTEQLQNGQQLNMALGDGVVAMGRLILATV